MGNWASNAKYIKYTKQLGNKYLAVVQIAKETVNLQDSIDRCILDSEALTWVATGEIPDDFEIRHKLKQQNKLSLYTQLDDALSYVQDEEVKDAARATILQSLPLHHLIYTYNKVKDDCKRSRVRVISNMLWDTIHTENKM